MFESSLFPAFSPQAHKQPGHDLFSFSSPEVIAAPSVDLFESDVDLINRDFDLSGFDFQVNAPYPSNTPTPCGPGSAITFSTDSSALSDPAFESLSSYSESFYNSPSSHYNYIDIPLDGVDMDFARIRVDDFPSLDSIDPNSFGALPPTPPRSPPVPLPSSAKSFDKPYTHRTSFSDYGHTKRNSISSSDYYSQLGYSPSVAQTTISPSHISANTIPIVPSAARAVDEYKGDPRKKYKCAACPRGNDSTSALQTYHLQIYTAFARAYNLKTHMATHDPNRLKPHVCPHRSCGRSFSRKHDLGRHLVSIHRDESEVPSIGVEKGPRGWCDTCGKGYVGRASECACHDVK